MNPSDPGYFDFEAYLLTVVPDVEYSITRLSGGFCNLTVRATPVPTLSSPKEVSLFGVPKTASLVLKYAPPFSVSVGPSVPFSQHRQVGFDYFFYYGCV